jgi:hypothetical protein
MHGVQQAGAGLRERLFFVRALCLSRPSHSRLRGLRRFLAGVSLENAAFDPLQLLRLFLKADTITTWKNPCSRRLASPKPWIIHVKFTSAFARGRKCHEVPYMAHLLGVASLVLGETGHVPCPVTKDMAIAALLHDAVEDEGGLPRLRDIQAKFSTGETSLGLHPGSEKNPAGSIELGFNVTNLEKFHQDNDCEGCSVQHASDETGFWRKSCSIHRLRRSTLQRCRANGKRCQSVRHSAKIERSFLIA